MRSINRLRQAQARDGPASLPGGIVMPFWMNACPALIGSLATGSDGLAAREADIRLRRFGPNLLKPVERLRFMRRLMHRFRNPLVLVLLGAAAISAWTGDVASFAIITAIVGLGILLDGWQEHRAETAVWKLRASVALREQVLRDGQAVTLPAERIVPGDVVLLSAGDLVPADGVILEARDFFVNEALLTGEPYPCEKHAGVASGAELSAATNAVFMGSSVISGVARLLVVATGADTQLGQIAATLRREPPPAPLERGTHRFGLLIIRLTILLLFAVLLINLLMGRPLLESFLFALALAVGLTPELLPMVVSVTLARGALRMAAARVIVKRLAAIHDLGSMDILCADKTGTLTEAHIRLVRGLSPLGADSPDVLLLAWLNSHFESGLRSPLDAAILERVPPPAVDWKKLDEVPFGFDRRRVSVLLEQDDTRRLIVKGAPEDMLPLCSHYAAAPGGPVLPLDDTARAAIRDVFDRVSVDGYRLLAIAWRDMDKACDHVAVADERALIFAGYAAFIDPPKQSAGTAIAALRQRGIRIKILTGDNELVAQHVCRELGIQYSGVLLGSELARLSDDALDARAEDVDLFCRVTPMQKNRVILALKRRGHSVGFLGDGVNDAPSLHTADVGISVDSAVDVAKDAADLILLEKDLGVLERGVREGRRTFGNIMKYVMMATSSNFGNMFSMAGASLLLGFLPMLPIQILLNNLLYDISEVPIPLDEVDPETLARPQHWDLAFVRNFMLALGPVSSLFDFLTFGLLLWIFQATEPQFQTGWFVESLATQVLVIFVIRTRGNPLRSRPHALLMATSLGVVMAGIALPFTPLGTWLGFVPLPAGFLAALVALTFLYLLLAQAIKRWFYGHFASP